MRRPHRIEVTGASMMPGIASGDHLLMLPLPARPGHVVAIADPRQPQRIIVKRLVAHTADGVLVVGDNPAASTDSRQFGPVPHGLVLGRVVYRYHPASRAGRVRRDVARAEQAWAGGRG